MPSSSPIPWLHATRARTRFPDGNRRAFCCRAVSSARSNAVSSACIAVRTAAFRADTPKRARGSESRLKPNCHKLWNGPIEQGEATWPHPVALRMHPCAVPTMGQQSFGVLLPAMSRWAPCLEQLGAKPMYDAASRHCCRCHSKAKQFFSLESAPTGSRNCGPEQNDPRIIHGTVLLNYLALGYTPG